MRYFDWGGMVERTFRVDSEEWERNKEKGHKRRKDGAFHDLEGFIEELGGHLEGSG